MKGAADLGKTNNNKCTLSSFFSTILTVISARFFLTLYETVIKLFIVITRTNIDVFLIE